MHCELLLLVPHYLSGGRRFKNKNKKKRPFSVVTFKQVKTRWFVDVYPMAISFTHFFLKGWPGCWLSDLHISVLESNAKNPT